MCGPAAPIMMAISMAMTAMSAVQQASAASKQAKFQKQAAEQNQRIADQRAADATVRAVQDEREIIQEGQKEEQRFRLDAAKALGMQSAAFASNGLLLDADTSAGMTLMQTREKGELNAQTIRTNTRRAAIDRKTQGDQEAWGFHVQSANFANDASLAIAKGKNARTTGLLTAGASLLSQGAKFKGS